MLNGALGGLLVAVTGGLLGGCGVGGLAGDCGPYLSSAECSVVRSQLGSMPDRPPPDPTNRFGRCQVPGTPECDLEDLAVALGRRLFFDKCLSADHAVGCVSCHDPKVAFIDSRERPLTRRLADGTVAPFIQGSSAADLTTPPPQMKPQLDSAGAELARWDAAAGRWMPVIRRPQASWGATTGTTLGITPRHSPTLYNVAYGAGAPPHDGGRTYGVTWMPWDGRYDSAWALVADVLEFGATQGTSRSYVAQRMFSNTRHREAYERMLGGIAMPMLNRLEGGLYVYPSVGSAVAANSCWWNQTATCSTTELAPTDAVRHDINEIFVNAGKALSAYMRRLRSAGSAYDRWLAGDHEAMSPAAQRGLRLFIGKAECIMCHSGPNFTDWRFHNLGVPSDDVEQKTAGSTRLTKAPSERLDCMEGVGPNPNCTDAGRGAWQMRTTGQCALDSQTFQKAGPPKSPSDPTPSDLTFTCQRADMPASLKRFDVAMDCRSSASDLDTTERDQKCIPASVISPNRCAYTAAEPCAADPACEWRMPETLPMPSSMTVVTTPRCVARTQRVEYGQFKTPTLRNVARSWPYMHNGALHDYGPGQRGETSVDDPTPHLLRVIEFYNQGGGVPEVGPLDTQIHPLHLSRPEMMDLVAFLMALTDESLATGGDPLTVPPEDLDDRLGAIDCSINR
ncbi:MAG: cytochrome c peroxidase [Polyangia bacterium]